MERKRVYSRRQAAAELGISESTLKNRERDGTIEVVRLGRRVLITELEISRLLGEKSEATR